MKLGEKIFGLKTPQVYWHEQLQNLDDSQFDSEHLIGMPKSENVVRQLAHELKKSLLKDSNVFISLDILQKELKMKKSKLVDRFIKFLAYLPLLIGFWSYSTNLEVYIHLLQKQPRI